MCNRDMCFRPIDSRRALAARKGLNVFPRASDQQHEQADNARRRAADDVPRRRIRKMTRERIAQAVRRRMRRVQTDDERNDACHQKDDPENTLLTHTNSSYNDPRWMSLAKPMPPLLPSPGSYFGWQKHDTMARRVMLPAFCRHKLHNWSWLGGWRCPTTQVSWYRLTKRGLSR